MPRYEYKDGKSNKFWEIKLEGTSFTTRYGKIGTDGRITTKEWDSEEKAQKECEKITNSKVKKGYELVEEKGAKKPAAVAADFKQNPELEEAIFTNPNDKEAWQVYGDWLEAEGDPRGELIALGVAIENEANGKKKKEMQKREQEILAEHKSAWLGDVAEAMEQDEEEMISIGWRYGFINQARLGIHYDWSGPEVHEMLDTLLKSPAAKFIQELTLGLTDAEGENGYTAELLVIGRSDLRNLRKLHVGDFEQEETEISWTDVGEVGKIYDACPNLESLTVNGCGSEFGTVKHDKLKQLAVTTGGLSSSAAKSIAKGKLPELTRLEVWFGAEEYGGEASVGDLSQLFAGKGYPKVKHLGLMNSEFQNDIAEKIVDAKILEQLDSLDLSMGIMTDVGAQALLDNASKLKHLKSINVSDNFIPDNLVSQLNETFGDKIMADSQKDDDDDDYRYVSVSE